MVQTPTEVGERPRRPVLLALAVGLAVGLACIGLIISIIAVPFFALALLASAHWFALIEPVQTRPRVASALRALARSRP